MSKIDREAIVISISRPTNGNPMPGTGGARKVRFSGRTCGVCCNQARLIQARWQMDGKWMEAAADGRAFAPVNHEQDTLNRPDPETGEVIEYPYPHSEISMRELFLDSQGRMWYASSVNNKVGYFYLDDEPDAAAGK